MEWEEEKKKVQREEREEARKTQGVFKHLCTGRVSQGAVAVFDTGDTGGWHHGGGRHHGHRPKNK